VRLELLIHDPLQVKFRRFNHVAVRQCLPEIGREMPVGNKTKSTASVFLEWAFEDDVFFTRSPSDDTADPLRILATNPVPQLDRVAHSEDLVIPQLKLFGVHEAAVVNRISCSEVDKIAVGTEKRSVLGRKGRDSGFRSGRIGELPEEAAPVQGGVEDPPTRVTAPHTVRQPSTRQ
jgi:hypothetical protein